VPRESNRYRCHYARVPTDNKSTRRGKEHGKPIADNKKGKKTHEKALRFLSRNQGPPTMRDYVGKERSRDRVRKRGRVSSIRGRADPHGRKVMTSPKSGKSKNVSLGSLKPTNLKKKGDPSFISKEGLVHRLERLREIKGISNQRYGDTINNSLRVFPPVKSIKVRKQ